MVIKFNCGICGKYGKCCYAQNKVPNHFFCSRCCQNKWRESREDLIIKNKDPEFRKKVSRGLKNRKKLLDTILDEINQKYKTNYSPQDIVLDFTREVMVNNLDNAEAEKIEAETRKTKINTLLNAAGQLPEATVIKQICNILDLDFDEVQTQLSEKISTRKSIDELSDEILNLENSET